VTTFALTDDAKAKALTAFTISDGTTSLAFVSGDLSAVDTMAKLLTAVQGHANYSKLSHNVTLAADKLTFTNKSGGVLDAPTVTGIAGSSASPFTAAHAAGTGAKNINDLAITSQSGSNEAMFAMDAAITAVNSQRASLGASMSRLEYAADNLQNVAQNTASARSRVLDADYASETTELARTQIIQQASTAMLAQANQSQQAVLSLLR
jgi:flagellin